MTIRSVVALLHHNDHRFQSIHYLIKPLIEAWQAAGIQVDVMRGLGRQPPADVLFPHLDLTITPRAYRRFFDRYALVVNRQLVDISKSRISTNLVGPHDSYDGPVIVKTERNYGGLPEQRLTPPSPLARMWRAIAGRPASSSGTAPVQPSDWQHIEALKPSEYPVLPSVRDVPPEVFANPRLVVEKFIPSRMARALPSVTSTSLGRPAFAIACDRPSRPPNSAMHTASIECRPRRPCKPIVASGA